MAKGKGIARSRHASLADMARALTRTTGPRAWDQRLPPEQQRALHGLRQDFHAGEIAASVRQLAAMVSRELKIQVSRNQMRDFLQKGRNGTT